tara:strand:+ start:509 stop:907 length:399 start_codon:yes stop_codon:yes gene_type:complete
MKKIILFVLTGVFYINAQVDNSTISSKYFESFTLDYSSDEYQSNEDGEWLDISFITNLDYVLVEIKGYDERKVWWEHSAETSDENFDFYTTEDGELIEFDYENQLILWYHGYNETFDRYENLDMMSKLEVIE